VLRRPVDCTLTPGVRMTDETVEGGVPAGPRCHVERVEDEGRRHRPGCLPSDQAPREHVDDEGDVDDARPGRAVSEVRHPQGIRSRGGEVAVHEVRGPNGGGVGPGGEAFLRSAGSAYALVAHETGHLVPADVMAGSPGGLGQLAPAVDRVVVRPQLDQLGAELSVTDGPGREGPGLGVVVSGGGDLQLFADRLDPPSTPTGLSVAMGVDEGDYFLCRRSSSAPKKLAAACKMSLARRSSRFSLRNCFNSVCSVVLNPAR